jgi:glycerol-3-phosphate dehydrogenase
MRIALALYDILALGRNVGFHKILSKKEVLKIEPNLNSDSLTGAALYWDGTIDDARLCLENALQA